MVVETAQSTELGKTYVGTEHFDGSYSYGPAS